jgi:hypothetical protein
MCKIRYNKKLQRNKGERPMTMPLNYETFVRTAFGFGTTGEMLDRWGDPAGIANTDCFTDSSIAEVKVAAGYAMEIVANAVLNHVAENLSDAEMVRLEEFTQKVVDAPDLPTIDGLITDFRSTVIDKYFDISQGRITLK